MSSATNGAPTTIRIERTTLPSGSRLVASVPDRISRIGSRIREAIMVKLGAGRSGSWLTRVVLAATSSAGLRPGWSPPVLGR